MREAHQLSLPALVECLKAFWTYGLVSSVPDTLPPLQTSGTRCAAAQRQSNKQSAWKLDPGALPQGDSSLLVVPGLYRTGHHIASWAVALQEGTQARDHMCQQ